jgi:hypothetical protein
MLTFIHFLNPVILLNIFCVIHGFLARLTTFPTTAHVVSNTHFMILFHCTSTFPLSRLIAPFSSSRAPRTSCHWVYNFSRSHLHFPLWNRIIFFNLVQIVATSKLWSESILAPHSVLTAFMLFLNWCFTSIQSSWSPCASQCTVFYRLLNHVLMITNLFLSQMSICVLFPEEAFRVCICFWKDTIQESNNVVISPFAFSMTVQQLFRPLWSHLLLCNHEPASEEVLL